MTDSRGGARAPAGLKTVGSAFWKKLTAEYTFRPDELRLLEDACREMDLIDAMEKELDGAALMIEGSMGQMVTHPLIQEVRQHRSFVSRQLALLRLPDSVDAQRPQTSASSARALAAARWGKRGA